MDAETSPKSRVNQADNFHTLFECLDRLVLQMMKHATELAGDLLVTWCRKRNGIRTLPFPWYAHEAQTWKYHGYHPS